jgi:hypothetical protein
VTVTLTDRHADLLWAAAYLDGGNPAYGASRWARDALERALEERAGDPRLGELLDVLAESRGDVAELGRRRLRLVRGDGL